MGKHRKLMRHVSLYQKVQSVTNLSVLLKVDIAFPDQLIPIKNALPLSVPAWWQSHRVYIDRVIYSQYHWLICWKTMVFVIIALNFAAVKCEINHICVRHVVTNSSNIWHHWLGSAFYLHPIIWTLSLLCHWVWPSASGDNTISDFIPALTFYEYYLRCITTYVNL